MEMRFFNPSLLKASKSDSPISSTLEGICQSGRFREELEDHGRNVGKGHGLRNKVVSLSKVLISFIVSGNEESLMATCDEMFFAYRELMNVNLPSDIREGLIDDAEQEIAEALLCDVFAKYIFRGGSPRLFTTIGMEISTRGWLAGLIDSVSELSKLVGDYLMSRDFSTEEELAIRGRYVEFGRATCAFLSTFKGVPPTALNASRRPGQGFQSKLVRVEELVLMHQRDFNRLRRETEILQKLSEVAK